MTKTRGYTPKLFEVQRGMTRCLYILRLPFISEVGKITGIVAWDSKNQGFIHNVSTFATHVRHFHLS